jgi:energy-coupling factor transport system ATP-binding protein
MIEVAHLTLEHPSPAGVRRVLDDLSISIADGEFVAIVGANGAGKTSFARCLNGLIMPTAGVIRIDGLSPFDDHHLSTIRRSLGMVFQNPDNQIVSATVERDIAFGLENLGLPREEMHRRVNDMLSLFHLEKYRNHPPHLLSGGEKQRLAIAGVVAMQPRHLIFDEPTSLLDYPSRVELLNLVVQLNRGEKTFTPEPLTILFITQFPEEALFAKRLLIFDRGRIKFDGPPTTIFQQIEALRAIGLRPPVEFPVWQKLQEGQAQTGDVTFSSIEDLILNPIL